MLRWCLDRWRRATEGVRTAGDTDGGNDSLLCVRVAHGVGLCSRRARRRWEVRAKGDGTGHHTFPTGPPYVSRHRLDGELAILGENLPR